VKLRIDPFLQANLPDCGDIAWSWAIAQTVQCVEYLLVFIQFGMKQVRPGRDYGMVARLAKAINANSLFFIRTLPSHSI